VQPRHATRLLLELAKVAAQVPGEVGGRPLGDGYSLPPPVAPALEERVLLALVEPEAAERAGRIVLVRVSVDCLRPFAQSVGQLPRAPACMRLVLALALTGLHLCLLQAACGIGGGGLGISCLGDCCGCCCSCACRCSGRAAGGGGGCGSYSGPGGQRLLQAQPLLPPRLAYQEGRPPRRLSGAMADSGGWLGGGRPGGGELDGSRLGGGSVLDGCLVAARVPARSSRPRLWREGSGGWGVSALLREREQRGRAGGGRARVGGSRHERVGGSDELGSGA